MKKLVIVSLVLVTFSLAAQEKPERNKDLKREFSVDTFYAVESADDRMDNLTESLGVGVGYFINKNFGVRGRVLGHDLENELAEKVEGSLIFRTQLFHTPLIAYAELGSRFDFETDEWFALAGPGISVKIGNHFEPYIEARHVNDFKNIGYFSYVAGIKFNF